MRRFPEALQAAVLAVTAIAVIGSCIRLARADQEVPPGIANTELRELADYASRQMRKPKLVHLPALSRALDPEIARICRCKPPGLFVPGTLYLAPTVDAGTVVGKSIELHELVHAVQYEARGAAVGCFEYALREQEAIAIQTRWLIDQGSGYRPLYIIGKCE